MEKFIYHNPTRLHFGEGVTANIGKTAKEYGNKALLVYGKQSIKKTGLYENIINQLKTAEVEVFEYCGIKPNPIIDDVNNAAKIGRENNIDFIIAVGGGSVIDSAKIISLAIIENADVWEIVIGKIKPQKAIPIIAVLTLAATGTEMNPFAVVQNVETQQKIGYGNPLIYPKESFLDPLNTLTVSAEQTTNGLVDTIAHCLEAWFGEGNAELSDRFVSAIIKEIMNIGPDLLNDLGNINLRSRMLYASTMALNGTTFLGRKSGDWGVHDIGHTLSMLYDLPHGATLSIAYPAWLKTFEKKQKNRIEKLGYKLFKVDNENDTIYKLESFFKLINAPTRLQDVKISEEKSDEIINLLSKNKINGLNVKMNIKDYVKITEFMFDK